jgi:predicted Rossmann-fold nucleotide-binding protein
MGHGGAEPRADSVATLPNDIFVGREAELGALRRAFEDAVAAQGRLVLIGGEPGIGKSRLAAELARECTQRGALVLWGRCWEGTGQLVAGSASEPVPRSLILLEGWMMYSAGGCSSAWR